MSGNYDDHETDHETDYEFSPVISFLPLDLSRSAQEEADGVWSVAALERFLRAVAEG